MGSNPLIPPLDRPVTACWICRRFLHKTAGEGLCPRCRRNAKRQAFRANYKMTSKMPLREIAVRELRIEAHRDRVGAEMEHKGILPDGWWERPIPKCCRLDVDVDLVGVRELAAADALAAAVAPDESDLIRRRDVERALLNAAIVDFNSIAMGPAAGDHGGDAGSAGDRQKYKLRSNVDGEGVTR